MALSADSRSRLMSTLPPPTSADLPALLTGWSERGSGSLPRRLAQSLRTLLDAGL